MAGRAIGKSRLLPTIRRGGWRICCMVRIRHSISNRSSKEGIVNQSIARPAALRRMSAAVAALLLAGCNALAPVNPPIAKVDFDSGYRVNRMLKRQHEGVTNDPHTVFMLTFSGGGTRAAAFSYGV